MAKSLEYSTIEELSGLLSSSKLSTKKELEEELEETKKILNDIQKLIEYKVVN